MRVITFLAPHSRRLPAARLTFGHRIGLCLCLLLAVSACLGARVPPQYSIRVWQAEDGLPQNAVTAILQTQDGYLWVGTYSGLVRFDGVRFKVFDSGNTPELQSSRVTSLLEDADQNLWIGHELGEMTRYRAGQFHAVQVSARWERNKISSIATDSMNQVWMMNQDGLVARLSDGHLLTPRAGGASGLATMEKAVDGSLWITRNGRISQLKDGELTSPDFGRSAEGWYLQGICASRDGGLWIANDGRLRKWRGNQWVEDFGRAPWGQNPVFVFKETSNGFLMAGTLARGLFLVFPDKSSSHFSRTNGLSQDWVRALREDREGNLWVGTGSGGLNVLRAARVTAVTPPGQWEGRSVLSVTAASDDTLWVGTEGAGLYHLDGNQWTRYAGAAGVANPFVWSMTEDARGQVWAGTWGGGLLSKQGDRFERDAIPYESALGMLALLPARNGDLWIGTTTGLLRRDQKGGTQWIGRHGGLDSPNVRAVVEAPDGTIWFGMLGGGLGQLKDGKLRQYRKADGLSSDFLQCLRLESDGTLWIGTSGSGLIRYKQGKFTTVGTAQGLPNNVICHIAEDDHGYFWISSYGGIFRVGKSELAACADGKIDRVTCLTYGRGEGMPTLECSGGLQPAGCRTSDGRLWFPTSRGLVAIDPNDVQTNALQPPVVIEQFIADGTHMIPAGGPVRIPPGKQRLEFHYTGLSFVAPDKVRFKHRLEGLDEGWVDAGTERAVTYTHVPPGDYLFRVSACNNDGVWNETGAKLAFEVLPHFWQTWWCRGLAGITVVGAVAWGVRHDTRRRMRLKLEKLERQRAIERERTRIAKDIHDDLGASLTRISMLSQPARGESEDGQQAARDLEQIYGTARELTRALDEIVWAVNPHHDTLDSLASYLCRFAQDFLAPAGIRCRLDVPVDLPSWPVTAEIRHNLFLAFKEGLHNVVKHAAATEVRCSLTIEANAIAVAVADNGKGGVDTGVRAGSPKFDRLTQGNGLINMSRRLEEVGGRFELESVQGRGTRLIFRVPVKNPMG